MRCQPVKRTKYAVSQGGRMMKLVVWIVFVILFILVTFFGLGPVLLADGSAGERAATLAAVIALYVLLVLLLRFLIKRLNNR
jgi:uncharacterized membrane protein YhaH (DUF805 family)